MYAAKVAKWATNLQYNAALQPLATSSHVMGEQTAIADAGFGKYQLYLPKIGKEHGYGENKRSTAAG